MAEMGFWRSFWLVRLSKPAGERVLHAHALRTRPRRILEVGLGTLVRTERLLAAARSADSPIHYVGLDPFEGRGPDDPPGVTLKEAHRRLHRLGKVQLVPGPADGSLSRLCNHLGTFELVLVSADYGPQQLERVWFFLHRLVTPASTVMVEAGARGGGSDWAILPSSKLADLAARAVSPVMRRAG
jgi:hypothetical protein